MSPKIKIIKWYRDFLNEENSSSFPVAFANAMMQNRLVIPRKQRTELIFTPIFSKFCRIMAVKMLVTGQIRAKNIPKT
jgi:hypothetical protein